MTVATEVSRCSYQKLWPRNGLFRRYFLWEILNESNCHKESKMLLQISSNHHPWGWLKYPSGINSGHNSIRFLTTGHHHDYHFKTFFGISCFTANQALFRYQADFDGLQTSLLNVDPVSWLSHMTKQHLWLSGNTFSPKTDSAWFLYETLILLTWLWGMFSFHLLFGRFLGTKNTRSGLEKWCTHPSK